MTVPPAASSSSSPSDTEDEWLDTDQHRWSWRNCRSLELGFKLLIFPWQWRIVSEAYDDNGCYQWCRWVQFGPLMLTIDASIGDVSSEDPWRARFALSEQQAWKRANGR